MLRSPSDFGADCPPRDDPAPPLTSGPGAPAASGGSSHLSAPGSEGLDLEEELAIHEEITRRRIDPPDLDPATEATLHRILSRPVHDDAV